MSPLLIISLYFGLGMLFFALVYAFPLQYRSMLKRSLLIIKTAGLKSKQVQMELERKKKKLPQTPGQEIMDSKEIETMQQEYSHKLDTDIERKTGEYQESSKKATRALFGLIVAWPLLAFVLGLSLVMESVYLTEEEVKQVEEQI